MNKTLIVALLLSLAWGCGDGADPNDVEANRDSIATLTARIDVMQARIDELEEMTGPDLVPVLARLAENTTAISANTTAIGDNTTAAMSNTAAIAALDASQTMLAADIAANNAGIASSNSLIAVNESAIAALETQIGNVAAQTISTNTSWSVGPGGDYETLQEAVAAAHTVRVMPSALLTLDLTDGTHMVATNTLVFQHPDGVRIRIVGNGADPSAVTLQVTGTGGNAIVIREPLSDIIGLTLDGGDTAANGIRIDNAAMTRLQRVTVQNFATAGVFVTGNGSVFTQANTVAVSDNGSYGALVVDGGILVANGLEANRNGRQGVEVRQGAVATIPNAELNDNGVTGALAILNSTIHANSSTATGNGQDGFNSARGSALSAQNITADMNMASGLSVSNQSFAFATGATITNNTRYGVFADWASFVVANATTMMGNVIADVPASRENLLDTRGTFVRR